MPPKYAQNIPTLVHRIGGSSTQKYLRIESIMRNTSKQKVKEKLSDLETLICKEESFCKEKLLT